MLLPLDILRAASHALIIGLTYLVGENVFVSAILDFGGVFSSFFFSLLFLFVTQIMIRKESWGDTNAESPEILIEHANVQRCQVKKEKF
ncbi:hypothetical protein BpHYR1_051023 [Brachionus plicatilis]|uniref:Uncharacterized protein n=1 Tax=Brachionus plicatilis TaxID=10195 RepID=A0A3M7SQU5_BRAPC|nr:hypothetical protein BpHYR1_051023 [Brachionus plicatilis]